jgi:putative membrane protein
VTSRFDEASILAIERPDQALWSYYLLRCLVIPPLFPIVILPAWFRYHTMRYRFTDEGISMSWGILFRREIILNYARIQDIHLRSNIVERWLGLARIQVQTASGSAAAEMTIEGLKQFEAVRDFLYSRMRGVKDAAHHRAAATVGTADLPTPPDAARSSELAGVLREVADELRRLRETLERAPRRKPEGGSDV